MSQDNVDIVRSAFAARQSDGSEAALRFFASDVVWLPAEEWPDGAEYRGHDGMRRLTASFSENFDDLAFDVHELRDVGDRVLVRVDLTGIIKDSGQTIRQPRGFVVSDFRDGRFGHIQTFASWQEALDAVGLGH